MRNRNGILMLTAALVLLAGLCLGAADLAKPIAGDLYTTTLATLRDNTTALATWFEFGDPANLPTGAKRINTSSKAVQRWNGTTWQDWAQYQMAADMTTAAMANKGVVRGPNAEINVGHIIAQREGQTDHTNAGLRSFSPNGAAVVALGNDLSASNLVHQRGGNGIEVRDAGGSLARIKAAPGVAADDLAAKSQLDAKLNVGSVVGAGTGIYTNTGTVTCTAGQQITVLDGGGTAYVNQQTLVVFAEVTLARGAAAGNTHAYITAATGGANLTAQIYSAGQSVAANGTITIQVVGVFFSSGTGTFTPRLSVISTGADSTVSPNGARISARPLTLPAI